MDDESKNMILDVRWLAGVLLAVSGHQLALAMMATVSSHTPVRPEALGELARWTLIMGGCYGLILCREWARVGLMLYTGIEAALFLVMLLRVLPGVTPHPFGLVVVVLRAAGYVLALIILHQARRLTRNPAVQTSKTWHFGALGVVCLGALVALVPLVKGEAQTLEDLPRTAKGELAPLAKHREWLGYRLRVVGMRDGFPVTENIGPWRIKIDVTADESILAVRGLRFAERLSVRIDLQRNALLIDDAVFAGEPITGTSPLARGAAYQRVRFQRASGRISGRAAILFLEDGKAMMDFDKIHVDGYRAREYGILSPVEQ